MAYTRVATHRLDLMEVDDLGVVGDHDGCQPLPPGDGKGARLVSTMKAHLTEPAHDGRDLLLVLRSDEVQVQPEVVKYSTIRRTTLPGL